MVVFAFTNASVNDWTRLCHRALAETHHDPLAGRTWSTRMGTIRYGGTGWIEFHSSIVLSCFVLQNHKYTCEKINLISFTTKVK
jgi:hypothetical protein